ncbi:hypothetical protein IS481_11950 [Caldimonas thermodepolymerans]|uniref:Uncharacterized protein n=1 Tax=Caldimonas thermodepolymerans TaxID=215580 RepID=A0A2S5T8Z7_9BURK|nr:hypothetical protein [Caldimonas thermodepolymerans]PPE71453.1 hypothetical protein C1702_00165 [Caldimonas thermodepolymerans]QPC30482.1 hypothetical protein IS481_11950 [Caldimonas thermodepolymerans]
MRYNTAEELVADFEAGAGFRVVGLVSGNAYIVTDIRLVPPRRSTAGFVVESRAGAYAYFDLNGEDSLHGMRLEKIAEAPQQAAVIPLPGFYVARYAKDTGLPEFSAQPKRHDTYEKAAREAQRLAQKVPGYRFGIFESRDERYVAPPKPKRRYRLVSFQLQDGDIDSRLYPLGDSYSTPPRFNVGDPFKTGRGDATVVSVHEFAVAVK